MTKLISNGYEFYSYTQMEIDIMNTFNMVTGEIDHTVFNKIYDYYLYTVHYCENPNDTNIIFHGKVDKSKEYDIIWKNSNVFKNYKDKWQYEYIFNNHKTFGTFCNYMYDKEVYNYSNNDLIFFFTKNPKHIPSTKECFQIYSSSYTHLLEGDNTKNINIVKDMDFFKHIKFNNYKTNYIVKHYKSNTKPNKKEYEFNH